ncbi:siderophore-interacting protein [Psychrobacter piscatorii]|uniref:siderophore-interacting protein n=1 Tax=Psychrobacter piscatorii TaxID=554343 RepID=UPI00191B24F7|nr:siderophore-interacting protein [Psychrobacter piscatorii]
MAKPTPRLLDVIGSKYLTPNMCRVTLGGAGLNDFPIDQESAYIKLMFPQGEDARPLVRTYTVSVQRDDEIDVDFALHEAEGPASMWARNAQVGDQVLVGGPGPKKLINNDADWFLLVGDMTALPAITVNLAQLPADARGHAVLEVTTEADQQSLKKPDNVEIHWVVNNHPNADNSPLLDCVKSLTWLEGQPAVWTACEFHSMRVLRQYFKVERDVPKTHLYVSSYWKVDSTEDQHKVVKRDDAQTADQ